MKPNSRTRQLLVGLALGSILAGITPAVGQLPAPPVSGPKPIHFGGYGGAVVGHYTGPGVGAETGLSEANAAVLVSGTLAPRLSYFGELEAASTTRQNWTGNEQDGALVLERLYLEYAFSDALRFRAGRFLTPVGQWNEIHAEPLTWTAHRPLTTYRPFAKSTTGVMAAGQVAVGDRDAGYSIFASLGDNLFQESEESYFLHAFGARAAIELTPGLFVGASGVALRASHPIGPDDEGEEEYEADEENESPAHEAREEDGEDRLLAGLDVSWRVAGAEVLVEATALSATASAPSERGAFVQLAVPILSEARLYAVGRTEYYDPVVDRPLQVHTLGLTYRPSRHITLKIERQLPDRPSYRVRDGWYISMSGIF
jgi:hypothetical protein